VYTTTTRPVVPPPTNPTAAPSTAPSDTKVVYTTTTTPAVPPPFLAGLGINANSQDACKREVHRLFRMRGHTPIQRNSREGYIYIKCECCRARCGVSRNVARGWQVTVCSSEANAECGSLATVAELFSTCDVCGDDQVSERAAVHCNAKHTLCSACFDNSVNTLLINADDKKKFMVSPCTGVHQWLVLLLSDSPFSGTRLQSSLLCVCIELHDPGL